MTARTVCRWPAALLAASLAVSACGASEELPAPAATQQDAAATAAEIAAERAIVVTLDPVAWTRVPPPPSTEPAIPGAETIAAIQTGARVTIRCDATPSAIVDDEGGPSQAEAVDPRAVCGGLADDAELLAPSPMPAGCPDLRYWDLTVTVHGTWAGRPIDLRHWSCDPMARDVATRWTRLLGMQAAGPDIW